MTWDCVLVLVLGFGLRNKRGCQWSLISHLCMAAMPAALHPNDMLEKITNHRKSWQTKIENELPWSFNQQRTKLNFPSLFHATLDLSTLSLLSLSFCCTLASFFILESHFLLLALMRRHGIILYFACSLFCQHSACILIIEFVQTSERYKFAKKVATE